MSKDLFQVGDFTLHSGGTSKFRIDCDALTDASIEALAALIAEAFEFSEVIGVPKGGARLAKALQKYRENTGPVLIVDDVLTTGASITEQLEKLKQRDKTKDAIGVVIFARGKCPFWVTPILELNPNLAEVWQ